MTPTCPYCESEVVDIGWWVQSRTKSYTCEKGHRWMEETPDVQRIRQLERERDKAQTIDAELLLEVGVEGNDGVRELIAERNELRARLEALEKFKDEIADLVLTNGTQTLSEYLAGINTALTKLNHPPEDT